MPITPTYPGVYIEELPSFSHSVTAAPTSVTVFVGYTHPFATLKFGAATEIFSFADYQANFGGFFSFSPWLPDYIGQCRFPVLRQWRVKRLGGRSQAHGLPGRQRPAGQGRQGQRRSCSAAASVNIDVAPATVTLTAREPGGVDPANNNTPVAIPTVVQLANVRPDAPGARECRGRHHHHLRHAGGNLPGRARGGHRPATRPVATCHGDGGERAAGCLPGRRRLQPRLRDAAASGLDTDQY